MLLELSECGHAASIPRIRREINTDQIRLLLLSPSDEGSQTPRNSTTAETGAWLCSKAFIGAIFHHYTGVQLVVQVSSERPFCNAAWPTDSQAAVPYGSPGVVSNVAFPVEPNTNHRATRSRPEQFKCTPASGFR